MGRTSVCSFSSRSYGEHNTNILTAAAGCISLKEKMDLLTLKDDEAKSKYSERRNSEKTNSARKSSDGDVNANGLIFEGINVKIQNIDDDLTAERIKEEFERFGEIQNCKIILPEVERKRKYAILSYTSPAEAAKAISYFNGKVISSNILSVTFISQSNLRRRRPSTATMQKIITQQSRFRPGSYYSPRSTRSARSASIDSIQKTQSLHSFSGKQHTGLCKTLSS